MLSDARDEKRLVQQVRQRLVVCLRKYNPLKLTKASRQSEVELQIARAIVAYRLAAGTTILAPWHPQEAKTVRYLSESTNGSQYHLLKTYVRRAFDQKLGRCQTTASGARLQLIRADLYLRYTAPPTGIHSSISKNHEP